MAFLGPPTKGGSDATRKGITPPESRAIGIAPTAETARGLPNDFANYSIETSNHPRERARESSGVAPDFIAPLKGYRIWKAHIQLADRPMLRRVMAMPPLGKIHQDYSLLDIGKWEVDVEQSTLLKLWGAGEGVIPDGADTTLQSLSTEPPLGLWPAREPKVAECVQCGHGATGVFHTCGVYALNESAAIRSNMQVSRVAVTPYYGMAVESVHVWLLISGAVWLWGDVAEHELGYRAQYGYPAEFYYVAHNQQESVVVKHFADFFDVPAVAI